MRRDFYNLLGYEDRAFVKRAGKFLWAISDAGYTNYGWFIADLWFFFFFFWSFCHFFWPLPRPMGGPRLGGESEL